MAAPFEASVVQITVRLALKSFKIAAASKPGAVAPNFDVFCDCGQDKVELVQEILQKLIAAFPDKDSVTICTDGTEIVKCP